ncbi:hypothetical protein JKP88DRAFT_251602 [Tribonema minus]|uniref:Thioredoxin domain-containing protein n=1 Tax=Tribonema minus TaxID=303371 RepID=A0A835ZH99_9STRA|nr:hypothetical protein JKP88DRAFT_251602 [Tribonema minus]
MTLTNALLALATALVAAAGIACVCPSSPSRYPPNFFDQSGIVVFVAKSSCGHCKRLMPVLAQLRADPALSVTVYDDDDDDGDGYGEGLGVEGFPTIFVGGRPRPPHRPRYCAAGWRVSEARPPGRPPSLPSVASLYDKSTTIPKAWALHDTLHDASTLQTLNRPGSQTARTGFNKTKAKARPDTADSSRGARASHTKIGRMTPTCAVRAAGLVCLAFCFVTHGAPTSPPPLLKKIKVQGSCKEGCEKTVQPTIDKWLGTPASLDGRRGGKKVKVNVAERGSLSCAAFAEAASRGDDLSFKVLGKTVRAYKDFYTPATEASAPADGNDAARSPPGSSVPEPVLATAGQHAWSGRVKKTDSVLTIVWTDDCDPKNFRMFMALPPTDDDGPSDAAPRGLVRAIASVPCDGDDADADCTWMTEVAYDAPEPEAESELPELRKDDGDGKKRGPRALAQGAPDLAIAAPGAQGGDAGLAADIELLTQLHSGDGDVHDAFHRAGGRILQEEGAVLMPSGRRLDDGTDIRVLIVYTAAAEAAFTDANGVSQIGQTIGVQASMNNQALANSNVGFTFTTQMIRTTYTEPTNVAAEVLLSTVLNHAADVFGPFPGLADTRDIYRFDMVQILIANVAGVTGCGSQQARAHCTACVFRARARRPSAGAHHDRGTVGSNTSEAGWYYAFGFKTCNADRSQRLASVMAYTQGCDFRTRVPFFSSPGTFVAGVQLGSNNDDNTRLLRENRVAVANWRISALSAGDVIDFGPYMTAMHIKSMVCPPSMRITGVTLRSEFWLIATQSITCTNVSTGATATLAFAVGGTTGGAVTTASSSQGFRGMVVGNNNYSVSQLRFINAGGIASAVFGTAGVSWPGGSCPSNGVMIGLRASPSYSGTWVDGIGLICGAVQDMGPDRAPSASKTVMCPPSTFVTSVTVRSGTLVDRVDSIGCGTPFNKGVAYSVGVGGTGGVARTTSRDSGFSGIESGTSNGVVSRVRIRFFDGGAFSGTTHGTLGTGTAVLRSCPTGFKITGIRASANAAGTFTDGLGFVCGRPIVL